jgi:hypothetical protein
LKLICNCVRIRTYVYCSDEGSSDMAELWVELEGMKVSELRRRVIAAGASPGQLDEADDAQSPKEALIGLVVLLTCQVTE